MPEPPRADSTGRSPRSSTHRRDAAGAQPRPRRARLARPPPGQHVDVRLTAEDGYQAQRSYSIASPPEDGRVDADGGAHRRRRSVALPRSTSCASATCSSCAARSAAISSGEPTTAGRCCSSRGGSGIVPLMAMLRARVAAGAEAPLPAEGAHPPAALGALGAEDPAPTRARRHRT